MRRRDFIKVIAGSATVWPLAARGQQSASPVIGFIRPTRADESGQLVAAVRQGLRESGYTNDKVRIETRWANGHTERLPKLAVELVTLKVAAIVASLDAVLAAKDATAIIPIIFVTGADPVSAGLVSSINRPGDNMTGVSFYDVPITGKRLELLRQLVPNAELIAVLQDPNFVVRQTETREIETAARNLGQKIVTFEAANEQEIDAAFLGIVKSGAGALFIGAGQFFNTRRNQLVGLAALHAIPASYSFSGVVAAGGLMSYGASITDAYRRAGIYAARVLNGERPGDLPVELPYKYELSINLKDRQGARPNCAPDADRSR